MNHTSHSQCCNAGVSTNGTCTKCRNVCIEVFDKPSELRKTFDEDTSHGASQILVTPIGSIIKIEKQGDRFIISVNERSGNWVKQDITQFIKENAVAPLSQEQEIREEFYRKYKESYAKGGFLTTDLDSSWQCDEHVMLNWFLSKLSSLRAADREALQLAYLKAFGNYVPLSSEDSEPEKMAETVMKVWTEKVREETREALVREIKKLLENNLITL